jgi:hypothetical protein
MAIPDNEKDKWMLRLQGPLMAGYGYVYKLYGSDIEEVRLDRDKKQFLSNDLKLTFDVEAKRLDGILEVACEGSCCRAGQRRNAANDQRQIALKESWLRECNGDVLYCGEHCSVVLGKEGSRKLREFLAMVLDR